MHTEKASEGKEILVGGSDTNELLVPNPQILSNCSWEMIDCTDVRSKATEIVRCPTLVVLNESYD